MVMLIASLFKGKIGKKMKYAFYLLIIVTIVCWYPTYDLFVKKEFFDENRSLIKTGFMTTVGCHEAANEIKAKYYFCESKVQWRRWFLDKEVDKSIEIMKDQSELPTY